MEIKSVLIMRPMDYLQREQVYVSGDGLITVIVPKKANFDAKKPIKVTIEQ